MESICWVGLGAIKGEKNGLGLHVSLALLSENTALINKLLCVSYWWPSHLPQKWLLCPIYCYVGTLFKIHNYSCLKAALLLTCNSEMTEWQLKAPEYRWMQWRRGGGISSISLSINYIKPARAGLVGKHFKMLPYSFNNWKYFKLPAFCSFKNLKIITY